MGYKKEHKKAEARVQRRLHKLAKHQEKTDRLQSRLLKAQSKLFRLERKHQSRGADVEELRAGAAGSSGLVTHEQRDIPGPPDPVLHPDDTPIG